MELRCVMERRAKLLSALRRELRISDGLVRRLKPLDVFRVNGESAHTNRLLVPGDLVTVTIEEPAPDFPAEDGPLDILYEDDCLIAVDKPAGLIVHPTFARQTGTLANFLLGYYRRTSQACGVHVLTRLDRDTMGVVIFAKNAWAHWLLMEELDAGRVEKVYEALTLGGPAVDEGEIDLPIAKRPNPSLLRYVDPSGKPARTRYRVLERGLACPLRRPDCPTGTDCPPICRLELRPLTGRTHQLRVHCSYLGFPILGDPQYGMQNAKCKMQNEAASVGAVIGRPREGSGYVARAICPPAEENPVGAVIGRPPEGSGYVARAICPPGEEDPVGAVIGRPHEASGYVARAICPPAEENPVGAVIGRPRKGSEIRHPAYIRDSSSSGDEGCGFFASLRMTTPVGTSIACPPSSAAMGQQLVAKRITLDHPLTGERLTFVSRLELAGRK